MRSPLVLLLLSAGLAAPPASAQRPAHVVCFRPAPLEDCRSFVLFEARGQSPFVQPYRDIHFLQGDSVIPGLPTKELSHSFGWDAGLAFNVAPRWAVGATVGVEWGEDSFRRSLALRGRRWLGEHVAVELAPGVFRMERDGLDAEPRMFTGANLALRAVVADALVVALRWDALDVPAATEQTGTGLVRVDPGGVEHNLSMGLGLESWAGAGASVLGIAILFIGIGAALGCC